MKAIGKLLRDVGRKLGRDDSGATAVEYALIVGAVGGLIVLGVFELGSKVNNAFSNVLQAFP